jgi:hypothetical protein
MAINITNFNNNKIALSHYMYAQMLKPTDFKRFFLNRVSQEEGLYVNNMHNIV